MPEESSCPYIQSAHFGHFVLIIVHEVSDNAITLPCEKPRAAQASESRANCKESKKMIQQLGKARHHRGVPI
jgi:hypothetical protein